MSYVSDAECMYTLYIYIYLTYIHIYVKIQPPADTGPIYKALSLVYREPRTD